MLYLFMAVISLSALTSFSLAMGIVHTVGWPLLTWPKSYNAMGYYPLLFILLITSNVLLKVIMTVSKKDRTSRNMG